MFSLPLIELGQSSSNNLLLNLQFSLKPTFFKYKLIKAITVVKEKEFQDKLAYYRNSKIISKSIHGDKK